MLLMPWSNPQHQLAHRLVEALESQISDTNNQEVLTACTYTIAMHPSTAAYWQANPELLNSLVHALITAAQEAGIHFVTPPLIRLMENNQLPPDALQIATSTPENKLSETANMPAFQSSAAYEPATGAPANAFLIINGSQTFLITQAVINIGRRLNNHLIIDDPRVSRNHAQLRAIRGRYVLFDLNSTGGTYVNGERVAQHPLKPGDVISLAGVPIIYGEDTSGSQSGLTPVDPLPVNPPGGGAS